MNLRSYTKEANVSSVNFTSLQLCTVVLTASQFLCLMLVQELNSCRCKSWTFALFSVSVWPRWETCKAIRAVRSATGEYSIFVRPSQWSSASLWRAYGKRMHVAQAHACGTHVCVALVCARVCVRDMTPCTCKSEMSREKNGAFHVHYMDCVILCCSCVFVWNSVFIYNPYITLCLYVLVCYSYILVWYLYALVCYSYALVCTRMFLLCSCMYSYGRRGGLMVSALDPPPRCINRCRQT